MRNKTTILLAFVAFLVVHTANARENMFNIKTAPISDLIGIVNVEMDIAVSEHYTLGPSYLGFNYEHSDVNYDANLYGVRANYYFKEALAGGWLLSMSATFGSFDISETSGGITYYNSTSIRIYSALVGYQAMWNHINLTFAMGGSYFTLPSTVNGVEGVDVLEIDTSFLSGIVPNVEMTLGWRF